MLSPEEGEPHTDSQILKIGHSPGTAPEKELLVGGEGPGGITLQLSNTPDNFSNPAHLSYFFLLL